MQAVLLNMIFIVSISAHFGKHVYVETESTWSEAQKHCRTHYTDLSPITRRRDEKRLKNATIGKVNGEFWIGLFKNESRWMWSGGGEATYTPWAEEQPDGAEDEIFGSVCWHNCRWPGWHSIIFSMKLPFFCLDLTVVEHKRTWENAIHYCRRKHTKLTSLVSETEHLLALSKIQNDQITERVWIGLRFLADRWLWVNGDPLVYQAWPQGDQDYKCPIWKRCGALTKQGLWEDWDCEDKLNFICY